VGQYVKDKNDLSCGQTYRPIGVVAPGEEYTLIGKSKSTERVRELIKRVAVCDMTVLIRGETGTGKGLVAHMLHQSLPTSHRHSFVNVNCPAIPDTLLESEMFGHEKGAFTGAVNRKLGRFEQAEGGTIFLDEIGHISPAIQAKLLDVVESKEFVRIGGLERRRFNARIITATNAPLERLIVLPALPVRNSHTPAARTPRGYTRIGKPLSPKELRKISRALEKTDGCAHRKTHGAQMARQCARDLHPHGAIRTVRRHGGL
jgi:hypothetical protein